MKCAGIVLAASFALAAVSFAKAEEPVQIDVGAEFRSSVPILGDVSRTLPEKVKQLSGASLRLTFHEPGKLFRSAEMVDALSQGRVAAAWACGGAFAAKDSAFAVFASAPFGPDIRWPPEMLVAFEDAWKEIVKEESAKNPNFARVYKSYADFRKNYAIWRHFSFLQ